MPKIRHPLGTIIAWVSTPDKVPNPIPNRVPDGWTKCDGRLIAEGPWIGRLTPDLNNRNVFLRGGLESQSLEYENDQILDHQHVDNNHTHFDLGHAHSYYDHYNIFGVDVQGFQYGFVSPVQAYVYDELKASALSYAQMSNSSSNVGAVQNGYSKGTETRPKNVKVVWLMKTRSD